MHPLIDGRYYAVHDTKNYKLASLVARAPLFFWLSVLWSATFVQQCGCWRQGCTPEDVSVAIGYLRFLLFGAYGS